MLLDDKLTSGERGSCSVVFELAGGLPAWGGGDDGCGACAPGFIQSRDLGLHR